ncbi:MAG: SAM-dependent methyltransferase, partial [Bacilli bacterium]
MDDFYLQRQRVANLANWNERVGIHKESPSYGTDKVRFGGSTLLPIETAELGSVSDKSLLHLQCHF